MGEGLVRRAGAATDHIAARIVGIGTTVGAGDGVNFPGAIVVLAGAQIAVGYDIANRVVRVGAGSPRHRGHLGKAVQVVVEDVCDRA